MNEYFTAISAHLDDKCDISVTPHGQLCRIVTIGVDCILYHREIETGLEKRYNLSPEMRLCNVAIATHGDKCFLAGANQIFLFDFATENIELFYTALGTINDIACSTQGRFLAIGSDEPKCIVIEIATKRV